MPIVPANRAAAHDTTNRTSTTYTTASISFVAGRTYMLAIRARVSSGTPGVGSITGGGNTWSLLQTVNVSNITLWLYYCVAASTTSGTIGITPDGVTTWTQAGWIVDEFAGAALTPVVQSAQNSETASHSELTVTLGAFANATKNVSYGVFAHNEDTALTAGSGFSDLGASADAVENANRIKSIWKTGEDTGVDITSATTSSDVFGIAVEIAFGVTILNFGEFATGDFSDASPLFSGGTPTVQSSIVRTGAYAMKVQNTSGRLTFGAADRGNLGRTAETFYTFYFRVETIPSQAGQIALLLSSGLGTVASISIDTSGNITMTGTTTSGTIATLSTGQWYRFDWRVTSNGTAGLSIDGGAETTLTANNLTQDAILLGASTNTTQELYWSTWIISDEPIVGTPAVRISVPIGAGTYSDWTDGTGSTYAEVDEIPHDSGTTYLQKTSGTNAAHTFDMQAAATVGVTGDIAAVKAMAVLAESSSTTTLAGVRLRSGTTDSDSSTADIGNTSYIAREKLFNFDPSGAIAWTTSGFDGIEVGPLKGADASSVRCTAVYALVLDVELPPDITATPDTAALTTSSFAPVVLRPVVVTPGRLPVATSGFAPAVTASDHKLATPGAAALVTTAYAPVPGVSADRVATPGALALVTTGFAPAVAAPRLVTPSAAALVTTGFAPVAATPRLATPGALALVTTGFAPAVSTPRAATPGVLAAVLSGFAPNVAATANLVARPDVAALVLTAFAPVLGVPAYFVPGAAALAIERFAPTVTTPRLLVPGRAELALAGFAPGVSAPRLVVPGLAEMLAVLFAPGVSVAEAQPIDAYFEALWRTPVFDALWTTPAFEAKWWTPSFDAKWPEPVFGARWVEARRILGAGE